MYELTVVWGVCRRLVYNHRQNPRQRSELSEKSHLQLRAIGRRKVVSGRRRVTFFFYDMISANLFMTQSIPLNAFTNWQCVWCVKNKQTKKTRTYGIERE